MNYDATIRELEEKRDFYSAAISALRKIATHDAEPVVAKKRYSRRPKFSAETRARMSEAARLRWARRNEGTSDNGNAPAVVENAPELVGTH